MVDQPVVLNANLTINIILPLSKVIDITLAYSGKYVEVLTFPRLLL